MKQKVWLALTRPLCRSGGVPDLCVGALACQRAAAQAGVPHLLQKVPPGLPVQVVQELWQEQLSPLPEQLELSASALEPRGCSGMPVS